MKNVRKIGFVLLVLVWAALSAALWFAPRQETSLTERRQLAQMPEISWRAVTDGRFMEAFETFTQDQFPLRDTFRSLKASFHKNILGQKDNNGIYITDGTAVKLEYPLDADSLENATEKFNRLYDLYLQDSRVLFAVVPDKNYYLADSLGYPKMDYDTLFSTLEQALPWAEFVDLTDTLSADSYYKTDTHWRQEALVDAAQRLCEALKVGYFTEGELTPRMLSDRFYGVYYGQAALPLQPDALQVLENSVIENCTVYQHETDTVSGIYDLSMLDSRDPYEVFLSGSRSLLTIENPQAQTDRELIVFRDSFGSSIVPLLLRDYKTVTVVDIRYLATNNLGKFLDFHGQDVLLLYSTLVLNASNQLK